MPKQVDEPPRIQIEGDDRRHIRADWSRSRKRLIITIGTEQVELTADRVETLASFLAAGPDGP